MPRRPRPRRPEPRPPRYDVTPPPTATQQHIYAGLLASIEARAEEIREERERRREERRRKEQGTAETFARAFAAMEARQAAMGLDDFAAPGDDTDSSD